MKETKRLNKQFCDITGYPSAVTRIFSLHIFLISTRLTCGHVNWQTLSDIRGEPVPEHKVCITTGFT
eukprot:212266-Amphidinium_carterae.1